jgi:hypothetical protein
MRTLLVARCPVLAALAPAGERTARLDRGTQARVYEAEGASPAGKGHERGDDTMEETVVAEEAVHPVKVGPNGRYFVDQKSRPVFRLGTTQWQLFRDNTLEEARTVNRRTRTQRRVVSRFPMGGNHAILPASHAQTEVPALRSRRVLLSRRFRRYYGRVRLPTRASVAHFGCAPYRAPYSPTGDRRPSARRAGASPVPGQDLVGVGTRVAPCPLHGSRRAELPHRALALDPDAQALVRVRMIDTGSGKPLVSPAVHALPGHMALLAATTQRPAP